MKQRYWVRRTTRSGKVVERTQFFYGERHPRRDRRKGNSSATKKENNMLDAVRRLARVLNCNYYEGCLLVTLTYDDAHLGKAAETASAAEKSVGLFVRRLTYQLKKADADPRMVWITADKDAETGDYVRLHHHLVITPEESEIIRDDNGMIVDASIGKKTLSQLWGFGFVKIKLLSDQSDYTPIANYFVRQAVNAPDVKKWHTTRNMEKPVIEEEIVISSPGEIKAPPGATVLEVGHYDIETGSHYIRYIRKEKKRKNEQEDGAAADLLAVREKRKRGPAR